MVPESCQKLRAGRGVVGKTAVLGMKDRNTNRVSAEAVENAGSLTLNEVALDQVEPGNSLADRTRSIPCLGHQVPSRGERAKRPREMGRPTRD